MSTNKKGRPLLSSSKKGHRRVPSYKIVRKSGKVYVMKTTYPNKGKVKRYKRRI